MRELDLLGAVCVRRDYVTRRIGGRNLKVLGQAQVTVLPLHRPNQHEQRVPPTEHFKENKNLEPQTSVSPTEQSPTEQSQNAHLRSTSSTVREVLHQVLSETTNSAPSATCGESAAVPAATHGAAGRSSPSGLPAPDGSPVIYKGGRGQNSPAPKPPTYPTPPSDFVDYFLTLPTAIQRLTESFKIDAWRKIIQQEALLLLKKEFIDCITAEAVLDYKATCELWEGLVRWIRWWQLTPEQRRQAALAACGIYEPENPNIDPRPIDPTKLMECAEEDPECLAFGIEAGVAWMEYADGTWNFYEGEYKPDFCEPDPPNCLPQSSENVTVETSASI